ncbi:ribose-phosphate pyrophosphokinase [Candidatus Bathyarchaeota archaeon]|nr:MAG: ribose-phosphate pyrophosphokinase [Candidatus Bathyarchaeota archaeon]
MASTVEAVSAVKVIPGPASRELGARIAEVLGVEAVGMSYKVFPDGESYVRFDGSVEGETVAIIQSTYPPQDKHLLELCLLADTARDLGARRVVAVVPYLAYARQDRRFMPGEAVSIRTVGRLLRASGVDKLITVDAHSDEALRALGLEAVNISAVDLLARYMVEEKGLGGAFALAPDRGALSLAERASRTLGDGFGWLQKERSRITGEVKVEEKALDVSGRTVIIFDDMISTGGTVIAALDVLKKQGASRVYAACTHPLLVKDALKKILASGCDGVVGTDSVPSPVSVVSVASLLARELRDEL